VNRHLLRRIAIPFVSAAAWPHRPWMIDTGATMMNRKQTGLIEGPSAMNPVTAQRCLPTLVSLALGCLLVASADSALALRPAPGAAASADGQASAIHAQARQRRGNATPAAYGQAIGNWGHAWWQWVSNFPAADDPILQDGNVDCFAGQSGKVWYLAGTFGGTAVRSCSIKKGKAIFFPLLNGIYWTPLDPAIPEDCTDEANCRAGVGANMDALTSWTCTVDGTPCVWFTQAVRAQSDARPFNIPPGSSFTAFGYAPGVRQISVADGTWVMLDPLPRGTHEIHFTATTSGGFSLDVTYHLTVGD
jgi:hypothetical protein